MGRGDSFQLQGQQGGICLTTGQTWATAAAAGVKCRWIAVLNDTVFSSFTGNVVQSSNMVGITIPAGRDIPGCFSDFAITSGVVIGLYE